MMNYILLKTRKMQIIQTLNFSILLWLGHDSSIKNFKQQGYFFHIQFWLEIQIWHPSLFCESSKMWLQLTPPVYHALWFVSHPNGQASLESHMLQRSKRTDSNPGFRFTVSVHLRRAISFSVPWFSHLWTFHTSFNPGLLHKGCVGQLRWIYSKLLQKE